MPVNAGLAEVSNSLLTVAILAYTVGMLGYAVEYAFGRRGAVASRAGAPARAEARVLAGAGRDGARVAAAGGGDVTLADAGVDDLEAPSGGRDAPAPVSPVDGGGPSALGTAGPAPTAEARASRAVWFGRAAVAATAVGLAAQVGCLATRGLAAGRVPWGNMYEFVSVVCAVGVLVWLVVSARRPVRHLGLFVLLPVVLLLGLAGTVLYVDAGPLMPALNSYWLWIHVSTASIAIGIFLVGFVLATLYLLRSGYDRRRAAERPLRFPFTIGARLPEAAALERLTFRVHAFAFPIWTFAVICGAIWAEAAWSRYWGWDPKETWAFVSWVVYAAYLHARATTGWRGTRAVAIALVGWTTMMINLYVINFVVSGLHSYSGV